MGSITRRANRVDRELKRVLNYLSCLLQYHGCLGSQLSFHRPLEMVVCFVLRDRRGVGPLRLAPRHSLGLAEQEQAFRLDREPLPQHLGLLRGEGAVRVERFPLTRFFSRTMTTRPVRSTSVASARSISLRRAPV